MRVRAAPMAPERRRAAVVAAATPLIQTHGRDVSTRQIAEAAGVAEGTLFRAFGDKEAIIAAVVEAALDERPFLAELDRLDTAQDLQPFLTDLVGALARRLGGVFELMLALRMGPPPTVVRRRRDRVTERVAQLCEPYREQLAVSPHRAAQLMRLWVFAGTHPLITERQPLSAAELVEVVLHGIAAPPAAEPASGATAQGRRVPRRRTREERC